MCLGTCRQALAYRKHVLSSAFPAGVPAPTPSTVLCFSALNLDPVSPCTGYGVSQDPLVEWGEDRGPSQHGRRAAALQGRTAAPHTTRLPLSLPRALEMFSQIDLVAEGMEFAAYYFHLSF